MRDLIGRNTDAGIEHLEANQWRLVQASQAHPALARVLDGICHEITQNLLHQGRIAVDLCWRGRKSA